MHERLLILHSFGEGFGLLAGSSERRVLKLYRRNLRRGAASAAELVRRIRDVLVAELAHEER